ncbi:MAG: hypothetical protein JWN49_231, partial [Parcubacteria group bacterium]|nr:hypothetical protein [Parcubacteria group bacterium]MDB5245102.1 hypothetical protein [Parcubacteria group bacterium]
RAGLDHGDHMRCVHVAEVTAFATN